MRKCLGALLEISIALAVMFAAWWIVGQYVTQHDPRLDPAWESVDEGVGAERSGKWRSVRNAYIEEHPECAACGSTEDLHVHHVKPFHERPDLELDPGNLITLCAEHHFRIGHDPDGIDGPEGPNWKESNPSVRRDSRAYRAEISLAP